MAQPATKAICNGWVTCKLNVLSSLLRLVTVDKYVFKSQPLQIAKRWLPYSQTPHNYEIFTTSDISICDRAKRTDKFTF